MFNLTLNRSLRSRGFSLIELAVVVAIIGILAAIAIPTFLGQREGAQDRSAQSSLRNAVVQARATAAANNSLYPGADSADLVELLAADEPALDFVTTPSSADSEISVRRVSNKVVVLTARSDSGTCWVVLDDLDVGTFYGSAETACDPALGHFDGNAPDGEWDLDSDDDPSNGYDGLAPDFAATTPLAAAAPGGGGSPTLSDFDILQIIYNELDGPNWTDSGAQDDFLLADPCDADYYIVCDGNGRVTEIWLTSVGASGQIPEEVGLLSELEYLLLDDNAITGQIPSEIGDLSNLKFLWLSYNQLSGGIPASFANLSNLVELYLFENQLSGPLPDFIGNLSNLTDLSIYENDFTGTIPATWAGLTSLGYVEMHNMQLSGELPAVFGDLPIYTLSLFGNGCLTAETPALEAWLAGLDPWWNDGC